MTPAEAAAHLAEARDARATLDPFADTHLIVRERNASGRGDLFWVRDGDIWGTTQAARLPVLDLFAESVQEAVDLLPEGSAGRERVEETRDYFRFVQEDALGLDRRWRAWRDAHR